jgi:hypothetical protein
VSAAKPRAVASGTLVEGSNVDCYVLDDGRCVLSQRGTLAALRGKNSGAGSADLGRYIARISTDSSPIEVVPVSFDGPTGPANGITTDAFVAILRAYVDALASGRLHTQQTATAIRCATLLGAFATAGLESLIHERTGYQDRRPRNAIERRIASLLREEPSEWEIRFRPSLVRALAPLWGITWTHGRYPKQLRSIFGEIYNMLLGDSEAAELRRRNATPEAHRHHVWLQEPAARAFSDELQIVELMAQQSRTKTQLRNKLNAHYRGDAFQTDISEAA